MAQTLYWHLVVSLSKILRFRFLFEHATFLLDRVTSLTTDIDKVRV